MKRIFLFICVLGLALHCSVTEPVYNNEYLKSAKTLEKALKENPEAANREAIEKRIEKFYELHKKMVKQKETHRKERKIREQEERWSDSSE